MLDNETLIFGAATMQHSDRLGKHRAWE